LYRQDWESHLRSLAATSATQPPQPLAAAQEGHAANEVPAEAGKPQHQAVPAPDTMQDTPVKVVAPTSPLAAHAAGNDTITLSAWGAAVDEYEAKHKRRDNDALPARMRILLKRLAGVPFTKLEGDNAKRNISNTLKQAREKDAPELMRLFPHLQHLDFESCT
jgi:hypothetical protein